MSLVTLLPGKRDSLHVSHLIHSMGSWTVVLAQEGRTWMHVGRNEQLAELLGTETSYLNLLQRQTSYENQFPELDTKILHQRNSS